MKYMYVLCAMLLAACSNTNNSTKVDSGNGIAQQPILAQETVVQHVSLNDLPALTLDPAEQYLGDVLEGEHITATFLVRNNSDNTIQLTDISAPCGCTTAEPETRFLQAGAFTTLKVDIDTFGKQGEVRKSVTVKDQFGHEATGWMTLKVVENPHGVGKEGKQRSIFDGKCAACHYTPAKDKVSGQAIYKAVCAMCHGEQANGASAPSLRYFEDVKVLQTIIANGTGSQHMPAFSRQNHGPLSQQQLTALAQWIISLDEMQN